MNNITNTPKWLRQSAGFTLLEILVALTIFAVTFAVLIKVMSGSLNHTSALEERVVAQWIAQNAMAEIRIDNNFEALSSDEKDVEMAGRSWSVQIEINPTPSNDIKEINIRVFRAGDNVNEIGSVASLIGFAGRY